MNTTHLGSLTRTALWLIAGALLVACGGGGGGSAAPSAVTGTNANASSGSATPASGQSVSFTLHFTSVARQPLTPSFVSKLPQAAAQAYAKVIAADTTARHAFQAARKITGSNLRQAAAKAGHPLSAGHVSAATARSTASTSRSPQFIDPWDTNGIAIFATDSTTGKTLNTVYADVSEWDYTSGIYTDGYYLSPLCTFTDGGGVQGQGDPSEGWDCKVLASAVPGHAIKYSAITLDDTPDSENSAGYGLGFSYGDELSAGITTPISISTTQSTTVTITLNPIDTVYGCIGDDYYDAYLIVVPVDGNTHALTSSTQALDADNDAEFLQSTTASDVFGDLGGLPAAITITSGNSSLVTPASATIAAPNPTATYEPCPYGDFATYYDDTCQGMLNQSLSYNGQPSGSSGAEAIPITWDNGLETQTPVVGYGSGTGVNPQGPYPGFYGVAYIANIIAPFNVTASNSTTLTASGPSTTLNVSLFCNGIPYYDYYWYPGYTGGLIGGGDPYICGDYAYGYSTDIGQPGMCPESTVTIAAGPTSVSSTYVVSQQFIATVTSSTAPNCIFHFNDGPALDDWIEGYPPDVSAAIQVTPTAGGAVFPIHLGNSPTAPPAG